MDLPLPTSPIQVWAVEDTSVQITWGALPPGEVAAWAGDLNTQIDHPGGAGGLDLDGLDPGTAYRIDVTWTGGRAQVEATTLTPPPGPELCRVATISDLHLGAYRWGASKMMRDRSGHPDPFPQRCARAALAEAEAWGAELVIIKGDAAHHQDEDHFHQVGELVDATDLPIMLLPGNHDVDGKGRGPVPPKVGRRGVPYVRDVASVDLAGIRIIGADTTVPGQGPGSLERVRAEVAELVSLGSAPFLIGLHHQLQRFRVSTHYPPGIKGPEANAFLEELAWTGISGLITSGHTHRNRSRRRESLAVSEVAATRDWPGVWAGYAVHEGGIRQVVRRVVAPDAVNWHEYSRRALFGIWGWWSAGPLDQRCFVHHWR